jgi:GNAT superfamily N-acetyltransferase
MVSIQTLISTAQGGVVGLLEDLVVRTQSRGQGLGTRLLHAAQDWARTRGMTRVQLLADTANAPALRFYARHGWQGTQLVCLRLRDVV